MEKPMATMTNLFAQLGLPTDTEGIEAFIASHRPLPDAVALHEATFWTTSQANFLREEILEDADWAPVIDNLNRVLHSSADTPAGRH